MEDTKQRILEKSLELFSTKGYDAVSVGEIAKAVGIKAPSLYNHFPGKQAIFDAILETTSAHYQKDTAEISVHVQDSQKDIPVFSHISEELLVEKVRQIFLYTVLEDFPLFCPKCRYACVIRFKDGKMEEAVLEKA